MVLSLCQRVKFKPTKFGLQIMVEDHNNTFKSLFQLADESTFTSKLDEEGYYTMSLWEFANIFGPILQEDCEPPVERMEIII